MRLGKIFLIGLFLTVLSVSLSQAGRLEDITKKVDAQGVEKLVISTEFGIGDLIIHPDDIKEAAVLNVSYDPDEFDFIVDYTVRGKTGYLDLESTIARRLRRSIEKQDNQWNLILSTRYPSEMEFDLGACEADIDLGGIPIKELSFEIGAASGLIEFSKPNPERMRELVFDIGASSLEVNNLGNANFEFLKVSCGAASCDLDLRGEYKGESDIELEVGVGSVDVILPRGVAVSIEVDDGLFSSVEFHGDDLEESEDDFYQSPDFDDADNRIYITVEVGMGSVDFYWK
ncbi:MAG: hypothetical protein JXA92_04830 [candidate division Zixibacteria bacterium]|nr:hypothetical protein [candidate division Zixibacteria bacterium]